MKSGIISVLLAVILYLVASKVVVTKERFRDIDSKLLKNLDERLFDYYMYSGGNLGKLETIDFKQFLKLQRPLNFAERFFIEYGDSVNWTLKQITFSLPEADDPLEGPHIPRFFSLPVGFENYLEKLQLPGNYHFDDLLVNKMNSGITVKCFQHASRIDNDCFTDSVLKVVNRGIRNYHLSSGLRNETSMFLDSSLMGGECKVILTVDGDSISVNVLDSNERVRAYVNQMVVTHLGEGLLSNTRQNSLYCFRFSIGFNLSYPNLR